MFVFSRAGAPCLLTRFAPWALALIVFGANPLVGCKKDPGFAGKASGKTALRDTAETAASPGEKLATESFDALGKTAGLVDVIWVVDNSGSMGPHIANVEANFNSFMARLNALSGIEVTLVSKAMDLGDTRAFSTVFGGGPGSPASKAFRPPFFDASKIGSMGLKHDDIDIASTNALDLAAVGLCAVSTSDSPAFATGVPTVASLRAQRVCGLEVPTRLRERPTSPVAEDFPGTLAQRLRPDAKLVLVFVTDDEAANVTGDNFLERLKAGGLTKVPTVFVFGAARVGLLDTRARAVAPSPASFAGGVGADAGCTVTRRSSSYERLATATQGGFFDICDGNWKEHFGAITASVESIARSHFELSAEASRVVEVKVDGTSIPESSYVVEGRYLRLLDTAVSNGARRVEITYVVKPAFVAGGEDSADSDAPNGSDAAKAAEAGLTEDPDNGQ